MNRNREAEDMDALDRELARMAAETQDPPEDFHQQWTERIRAEAETKQGAARKERRRQWRYVLSAAAVFVFLITGTLLTRNQKNGKETSEILLREESAEVTADGALEGTEAAGVSEPDGAEEAALSEEYEAEEGIEGGPGTSNEAILYAMEAEEEDAEEADLGIPEMYAYSAAQDVEKTIEGGGLAAFGTALANSAPVTETSAKESADFPQENNVLIAGPDTAGTEEEDLPVTGDAQEDAEEQPGLAQETLEFLKDMGAFILKALPFILGAAALAFAAAVIDRVIREKRGKKS